MIYTAIIVACLVADPTDCRTYEQPLTELSANPGIAFVQAQAQVAQWFQMHRGFTFESFRLEPGRGA